MANTEPNFYQDLEIINDPHDYFDMMRSKGPMVQEPHYGTVMVTGYDAAMEILRSNNDDFSSIVSVVGPIPPMPFAPEGSDISEQIEAHRDEMPWADHLACFDGKKHTDYRSLLMKLLTPQRIRTTKNTCTICPTGFWTSC